MYSFQLFDITGKTVFNKLFDVPEPQIAFPIEGISPGLYIIQIEHNGTVQNHKVIKSE